MSPVVIPTRTLQRLPVYLRYLQELCTRKDTPEYVSATTIAQALGLNPVSVRKDLAAVCTLGRPKVGYQTKELMTTLEQYLGYHDSCDAVLVGAGRLGLALLEYEGFRPYGLNILAGFDKRVPAGETETTPGGKQILSMDKLPALCQRLRVRIGVITAPASAAQQVADLMVQNGIRAIWNFAPTHLNLPPGVLLQNEDIASSLAVLSRRLSEQDNL